MLIPSTVSDTDYLPFWDKLDVKLLKFNDREDFKYNVEYFILFYINDFLGGRWVNKILKIFKNFLYMRSMRCKDHDSIKTISS